MYEHPSVSDVAALIADPSRAAILMTLLGGQTLLASELARVAHITPQTASSHLAKLVDGGLLISESHGRHKYFRLASADVAHLLEAMSFVAKPAKAHSLRQSDAIRSLHFARTCYDHLAGEVGVALTSRMLGAGWVVADGANFVVTSDGRSKLLELGVDVQPLHKQRRAFARQCLDWTERRYHVAGALGAAITGRFFELQWIKRTNDTRAVAVTDAGAQGLLTHFGIDIEELRDLSGGPMLGLTPFVGTSASSLL